jgi:F-type H+-transporting ATPase subunit g
MRPQIARTAARTLGRRANSSNAADKAKAAAEDAANKAKSAAQDIAENPQVKAAVESANAAFNQASAAVSRVTGPVGDKVGNMLGAYKQPVTYNWNVFTSLCRQVYQAEKLAPPTQLSQWASAYSQIFSAASSPAFWQKAMSNGQAAKIAVAGVEAYGLYKIGEIIGRRNLVGYKSSAPAHH